MNGKVSNHTATERMCHWLKAHLESKLPKVHPGADFVRVDFRYFEEQQVAEYVLHTLRVRVAGMMSVIRVEPRINSSLDELVLFYFIGNYDSVKHVNKNLHSKFLQKFAVKQTFFYFIRQKGLGLWDLLRKYKMK